MPQLTITVWNVQDYGQNKLKFRGTYTAIHNFIAWVVLRQQTDILFLLEMTQGGTARLLDLRVALGTRVPRSAWFYDWVKGAIADNAPAGPNTNITTAAQLGWTDRANGEGYAVFFRDSPNKFRMTLAPPVVLAGVPNTQSNGVQPAPLPAGIPAHALSIVLEGRPPVQVAGSSWAHVAPAFNPAAPPAWDNLDFPVNIGRRLYRPASRRPVFCVIELNALNGTPDTRLMPLLAYHAPSNANSNDAPPSGTQAASFARQLYQARNPNAAWGWLNNTRALACGDFNVDGNPFDLPGNRQRSYASYQDLFATSGAGMTASAIPLGLAQPANNTALSLTRGIGGPALPNGRPWDFTTAEFDNIFLRGFPAGNIQRPPRGQIYDLITAVRPGGSLTGVPVRNFIPVVTEALRDTLLVNGRPVRRNGRRLVYPQITNWRNFYDGLYRGQFPDNRSAAEFIKLFVSDHLPITTRVSY